MKYALLIYDGPEWEALSEADREVAYNEYYEISAAPEVVGGEQLYPAATAKTVSADGSKPLTTNGSVPPMGDALGGYFVVEAADEPAAVQFATRIPAVRYGGKVEVRPIVDN